MAAQNFAVTYQLVDGNGAPVSYELLAVCTSGTLADMEAMAGWFASNALGPVTQSAIKKITIHVDVALPGGLPAVVASTNNSDGAQFLFDTQYGDETYGKWLPNAQPEIFNATDPAVVNPTDTACENYINALLNTGSGIDGKGFALDRISPSAQQLVSLKNAVKSIRKQRRALSKRRSV